MNGGKGDICKAKIKDFKVDRQYPDVKLARQQLRGTSAILDFETPVESNASSGSGIDYYKLVTQQIPGIQYTREDIVGARSQDTGLYTINTNLYPNMSYNVYLLVADKAGNEAQFIQQLSSDDDPNALQKYNGSVSSSSTDIDPLFYGYRFTMPNPPLEGSMTLKVLDSEGNEKVDGTIGVGDKIEVVLGEDISTGVSRLDYEWLWQVNGSTVPNNKAFNDPVYTVTNDDIGKIIVCHASDKDGNLSGVYCGIDLPGSSWAWSVSGRV